MAAYPPTYRAIRRTPKPYPLSIQITTETLPQTLGPKDVVLKIHAASLNYRDVAMLREGKYVTPPLLPPSFPPQEVTPNICYRYPIPVSDAGIEGSCCAASVVAVGSAVTKFTPGDRVAPTVNLNFLTDDDRDAEGRVLGGDAPGVLREYAVFEERCLVRLPAHVSWEEVRIPFLFFCETL